MKDFITSTFNIEPHRIESFHSLKEDDSLNFYITLIKEPQDCPVCGAASIFYGTRKKIIKHPTVSSLNGNIVWMAHRYRCSSCHHIFLEKNPFSFGGLSISIATQRAIMFDLKNPNLTYKDIAAKHNVSPSTVQRLFDSWVTAPRQKLPESIGIDEIHSKMAKYNSSYLCTIVDNVDRSLIEILPTRAKYQLNNYFDTVPQDEKNSVLYVTIDMWEPYLHVANRNFKNAVVAIDPFHVVKHLSDAFSKIRIDIMNQSVYGSDSYYLLKSWHRLLETDYELDNEPKFNHHFKKKLNYRDLYNMLLNISEDLSLAYQLKETYRRFNKEASFDNAEVWLNQIIDTFTKAGIPRYREFVNLLHHWKSYIINSFLRPHGNRKLSNALSENINSQIRAYLAVSRGNANFTRFRKRMLYCLNRHVFYSATGFLKSDKRQGKPRKKETK